MFDHYHKIIKVLKVQNKNKLKIVLQILNYRINQHILIKEYIQNQQVQGKVIKKIKYFIKLFKN
jgi:hypothetical protein